VPLDALYGMLDALGVKTSDSSGDLQQQLQKGAERLKQLIAERPEAVRSDPELERLSKLADDAEAEGAIGLALKFRDQASSRADTLLAGKQAEAERLRQDMVDIANTYAANAATAVLNFEHLHAAELYGKAFEAVKDWDKAKAVDFRISQGNALSDAGYYTGDNEALRGALTAYREALALTPKEADPATWGKIQNDIGQAQQSLGSRLTDMAMLNDSVASFELAMSVRTETAAPSDWAVGQNNLGNVLFTIGRRGGDIPTLEKSVAAFDAALTVFKPDTDPVRWATTQSNRASAQLGLADAIYASTEDVQVRAVQGGATDVENLPEVIAARARAVEILTGSVAALEDALKVRSRADSPLDWAMIQHARAAALSDRGKLTASAEDVKLAVEAFRDVMTAYDKTRMPVQWATSSANLAATLRQYAGLIKDGAPLAEAAALLEESIGLMPRAQSPLDWAELNTKLGNVWADAVDYGGPMENTDKAVAAYRAAMEVQTPEQDLAGWERLQLYVVSALIKVATPAQDLPRIKDARATAAHAAEVLKAHGSADAALFEQWLPTLDQFIGMLGG
jgi:tetratricopeptide (TPR) repeat protein